MRWSPIAAVAVALCTAIVPPSARAGTNVWTSLGPAAGPVVAVAVDPGATGTLYAATYWNGVFKSTDGGRLWSRTGLWWTGGPPISALVIDPLNPETVYVGLRESSSFLKTTDGGESWRSLDLFTGISALSIDAADTRILYAGSPRDGIFKSTDAGASWSSASAGLAGVEITSLAVDPTAPGAIYAGTSAGVFRSGNGGRSWEATGLARSDVVALVIGRSPPGIVYAGTRGGGVFATANGGASWTAMNDSLAELEVTALAVDPAAPMSLYAGTTRGVFASPNGTVSWAAMGPSGTESKVRALAIDPTAPGAIYAGTLGGIWKASPGVAWTALNTGLPLVEIGQLAVDPIRPGRLYATSYPIEGLTWVFTSGDSGRSWQPVNTHLDAFVSKLVVDPGTPGTLYAGAVQDGMLKSIDGGASWTRINQGLALHGWVRPVAIDPITPSTLYAGTVTAGVFKTTNGGASWRPVNAGLQIPNHLWVPVLAIDPVTPSTLYAGTGFAGVFKSANGGASWTPINDGLADSSITALAIDPRRPETLYAGTSRAGVFKSADGGASWIAVNAGLPNAWVKSLVVDPIAPNAVYVNVDFSEGRDSAGGVFRSADGGATWGLMNSGLTFGNTLRLLAVDPATPNRLYGYGNFPGLGVLDFQLVVPSEPFTVIAAARDSFVRAEDRDGNEGANPGLWIASRNRVLVSFADADFVPAAVAGARLVMTVAGDAAKWGTPGRRVSAHPLLDEFAEGDGQSLGVAKSEATRGSGPGVTWICLTDDEIANNRADCPYSWNAEPSRPATAGPRLHTSGLTGEVQWDVTADVRAGATAWVIRKQNETQSGQVRYYSREGSLRTFGDLSRAPQLIVEWLAVD